MLAFTTASILAHPDATQAFVCRSRSLQYSDWPLETITLHFIVEMPGSDGLTIIMTVIGHLTKNGPFCSLNPLSLIRRNIPIMNNPYCPSLWSYKSHYFWSCPQFISWFWWEVLHILGVHTHPFSAYHPQINGQTERVNQNLEQFLWGYNSCIRMTGPHNYHMQNLNTKLHISGHSLFFANYRFHPELHAFSYNPAALDWVQQFHQTQETLRDSLEKKLDYKRHVNQLCQPSHLYLDRPSCRLDH